jgi:fumarylpyruvate hydrolase
MDYAFPLSAGGTLPVEGTGLVVPVRRIYCVGRNYAAHAREMGSDPDREPPFFFMKPADAIVPSGSTTPFPPATANLQHEIELVVVIGRGGSAIVPAAALDHVYGYAVGLDMTRRDLQNEAKRTGRPWDMGKGFDQSAPCSAVRPASRIGHPAKGAIWVKVNGQMRQSGDLAQQIWSVPETIACLSGLVTLAPGDLVFTGTPDGVGPVQPGDRLEGGIDGIGDLVVTYR